MGRRSIKAVVEVERGSSKRALIDSRLKIIKYREVSAPYPFAYGFILDTSSEDGDGIDCYILTNQQLEAGEIIDCVPIGLLEQFENEEVDCKIITILEEDDFRFEQEYIGQIEHFILQIFKKHPEIVISFGEYKDGIYTVEYINNRRRITP